MNPILIAPHGDDEVLFAAFTCMRARAHVIICSHDPDPEVRKVRSLETTNAIQILGCSHHEIPMSSADMDWGALRSKLEPWNSTALVASTPDTIYAPAVHEEGHEQHNRVGEIAIELFGDKVVPYLTYAPRGQRQTDGHEVVPTADEIQRKLRALACYRSQIEHPSTRAWFFELLDLREWLA